MVKLERAGKGSDGRVMRIKSRLMPVGSVLK